MKAWSQAQRGHTPAKPAYATKMDKDDPGHQQENQTRS